MRRTRTGLIVRLAVVALGATLCLSCSKTVRTGRSGSYLVVEQLLGAPGASPDKFSNPLSSDVITTDSEGMTTVFEDAGQVKVRAYLKDPTVTTEPTTTQEITLTGYHVAYRRADGLNTPGVDVPFPFDGGLTGLVPVGQPTALTFVLVRAQAKVEAPLRALRDGGGAGIIYTIAEVTFYGHDQAGNAVSVMATMDVNFADWSNAG